jgi:hypothetical protein
MVDAVAVSIGPGIGSLPAQQAGVSRYELSTLTDSRLGNGEDFCSSKVKATGSRREPLGLHWTFRSYNRREAPRAIVDSGVRCMFPRLPVATLANVNSSDAPFVASYRPRTRQRNQPLTHGRIARGIEPRT